MLRDERKRLPTSSPVSLFFPPPGARRKKRNPGSEVERLMQKYTQLNIGGGAGGWGRGAQPPAHVTVPKISPAQHKIGLAKCSVSLSFHNIRMPLGESVCCRTFLWHRRLQSVHFPPFRSTMKQDRLTNCLLLNCNQSITDTLDTVKIAKRFACANELHKRHFGKFE